MSFPQRFIKALAGACVLALASPATTWAYTPPDVGFSFGPVQADGDPDPFVTEKGTGALSFGGVGFGWTMEGYGRASLPEGRMNLLFEERWDAPTTNDTFSYEGHSTAVRMYETLVAGASGSITITLSGHGIVDASNVVSPSSPLLDDSSWAGFGFGLYGTVYNPGCCGLAGGGSEARATLDDGTNLAGPSVFAFDVGTPGERKAIDASFTLDDGRTGGTLTLTAWVNPGDRFNFTALAAARGWVDHINGAYARADLLHTAGLSVSGSPGMTWVSESGVFLAPVPEPASALLAAAGLAGLALRLAQLRR